MVLCITARGGGGEREQRHRGCSVYGLGIRWAAQVNVKMSARRVEAKYFLSHPTVVLRCLIIKHFASKLTHTHTRREQDGERERAACAGMGPLKMCSLLCCAKKERSQSQSQSRWQRQSWQPFFNVNAQLNLKHANWQQSCAIIHRYTALKSRTASHVVT